MECKDIKIIQQIRDLGEKEIIPYSKLWDEQQIFPTELFKKLGKIGFMGVCVPKKYGGLELGYSTYISAITTLASIDGAIAMSMAAHNSLCVAHILQYGNDWQKQQWLPTLVNGEGLGAWALTEPQVGSDASNVQTVAKQKGDVWVINGRKKFITHGKNSTVVIVLAHTHGMKNTKKNITAFVVPKNIPGLIVGKEENKMGMRASETSELFFDNCYVPGTHILGNIGEGFLQAMQILDAGRISIAAIGLGIAQGAFQEALQYAKQRHQFQQAIISFQAISFKLAKMATKIEAGKLLTMQAAQQKDAQCDIGKIAAMAKYFTSEVAIEVTNEALQIFGGNGYCKDYPVEKYYRDAKICTIGEGTSEMQQLVIAKYLKNSIE